MIMTTMPSPVGVLTLLSDGKGLSGILFEKHKYPAPAARRAEDAFLAQAKAALERYFAGAPPAYAGPLSLKGTPFQLAVWQALQAIPSGQTVTYAAIAQSLGAPRATRAVGAAVGRNPVSILIPCHRVIGANGKLTGFAGGLERKQALLALEGLRLVA
jgi:methylated-DNA-[protein]-cysteine S-methyltransferase